MQQIRGDSASSDGVVKNIKYTYNADGSYTEKTTQTIQNKDSNGNITAMSSSNDPISEKTVHPNGKSVEKIYSMDGSIEPKTITIEGNKKTTVTKQPTNLYNNSSYTKTQIEINGKLTEETYKKTFYLPSHSWQEGYTIKYDANSNSTKTEYRNEQNTTYTANGETKTETKITKGYKNNVLVSQNVEKDNYMTREYYSNYSKNTQGQQTRIALRDSFSTLPGIDGLAAPRYYEQVLDDKGNVIKETFVRYSYE